MNDDSALQPLLSEILELGSTYAEAGWNGEGAQGISPLAVERAVAFLRALPDDLPLPEIAPEPDGSIAFDWMRSRTQLFSVSVGTNDRLAYAWLDGAQSGHGVEEFQMMTIPRRLLDEISGTFRALRRPLR